MVYFSIMAQPDFSGLTIAPWSALRRTRCRTTAGDVRHRQTLVGYFAASVGVRLDVEHSFIRLLLCRCFFIFHQFFFWVMSHALLGRVGVFDWPGTLVQAVLNAVIGVALFTFLDKLKERS